MCGFGNFECVLREHARFIVLDGGENLFALLGENVDEAVGGVIGKLSVIHVSHRNGVAGLAHNAAKTDVCILHVRTRVAFEAHDGIPVKADILQAAVLEVVEGKSADTDLACNEFLVFEARILFVDEFENLLLGGFNHIAEEACRTGTGLALFPLAVDHLEDHAERNVVHVLVPFAAHLLEHVEHLLEVECLSQVHHIKALVEVVFLFAVNCGSEVAGCVQRGTVTLADKARVQVEFIEHHHVAFLAVHQQVLFAEFVEHGRNLVFKEGFAGVVVKANAHHVVNAHEFLERCGAECGPKLAVEFVALFELRECSACFVFEAGFFLGGLGEACVKDVEFLHGECVQSCFIGRELFAEVHHDELTECSAPVAQVVDAFDLVTGCLVDAGKRVTDHCRTQMVEGEFLTDVRGAVVDADNLAIRCGVAVFQTLGGDFVERRLGEKSAVDEEVEVTIHGFNFRKPSRELNLCC